LLCWKHGLAQRLPRDLNAAPPSKCLLGVKMQRLRMIKAVIVALAPSSVFADECGPPHGPPHLKPPFTDEHSDAQCKKCTATSSSCEWCPLSQSCSKQGKFYSSCMRSSEYKPIRSGAGCGGPKPAWMALLETRYGTDRLEKEDSDVMRCLQGSVDGWGPVWPEMKKTGRSTKEIVRYSCMSALVRESVLLSLGPAPQVLFRSGNFSFGRPGADENEFWARRLDDDQFEVEESLTFCEAYHVFFPTEDCQAWSYVADQFRSLRQLSASDMTEQVRQSILSGPLMPHDDFEEGFHTTYDGKFTLNVGFKEYTNLMKLIHGQSKRHGATPLGQYLGFHRKSLLQRIYAFVRIRIQGEYSDCLLFENEAHGLDLKATSIHADLVRYDLKGRSRSQTKKQRSSTKQVLLNGDFREREQNRLPLKNWHCKELKKALQKDASYLAAHGMAEYSLFVEIATGRGSAAVTCSGLPGAPHCSHNEQEVRTSAVSVIDYLDNKVLDSSSRKYSAQMMEFANEVCLTNKKESLDSWQIYLILGVFAVLLLGGAFACWKFGAEFLKSTRPHELRSADAAVEMTMRNPGMQPGPAGWPAGGAVQPGYPSYPGYPNYTGYPGQMPGM